MKAKLFQWDPQYLRDGVIHEGVKPARSRTQEKTSVFKRHILNVSLEITLSWVP